MCNAPGEACGRIFLNFDATDVEHYLVNNPHVFNNLVNRHQNILVQQNNAENSIADESAQDEDEDGRTSGFSYAITRLNLGMHIRPEGILFSRIDDADRADQSNIDDIDEDSGDDSSGEQVFRFPHVGIGMRFNANGISIARLSEFEHQEEEEDEKDEEDVNMEVDQVDNDAENDRNDNEMNNVGI